MISTLDVKVTLKLKDLTERERKILHTLNANLIGVQAAKVINNSMAMNFLEKDEYDITHYELVFPEPINEEDSKLIQERLQRIIPVSYKMSELDIDNLVIEFKENGFENR